MNRRRVQAGAAALVLVLGLSAYAGWRWWHNRPPYGPEVLAATATLEFVNNEVASAALGQETAPRADTGDQLALGRVTWQPPAEFQRDSTLWIVLLDKRTQLKPTAFGVSSPRQDKVGIGSHGYLQKAADRHPWLRGVAGHEVHGGWQSGGSSLFVAAADATPLTFVALFPANEQPHQPELPFAAAPIAISDLLVALISMGPDGQFYWAHRLLG
ncbi:hypothetical protein [Plantactinospora soyae]|uniref:HAMP domain-containing protein n=1 Tax=Plantactinospora soyae TaxID=1544732 RepID=A0A927LY40_9ACTN|nr:hypothetical protein [Plantactinospora soyae]MBE1484668.1 HAMP domain-containing protein [Plantactinospora soyae]